MLSEQVRIQMTNTISGRITLNLVAGILITVITVIAAIFWMAARQDDQASASTETMVVGGVDAVARRAQALANDYGWWDDAYQAYVRRDEDWFYTNVGASVSETRVADLFAVVSPEGEVVYGWVIDDKNLPQEILTPEVIEGIRDLAKGMPVESLARAERVPPRRLPPDGHRRFADHAVHERARTSIRPSCRSSSPDWN